MTQLTFDKCQLCHILFNLHERQSVAVDLFNFLKTPELQLKRPYDGAHSYNRSALCK